MKLNGVAQRICAAMLGSALLAGCELSGAQPAGYQAELRLAEQFYKSGQYSRAYDLYNSVEAKNEDSIEVQLALGETHLRNFAFLKAEAAYSAAKQLGAGVEADIGLGRVALARNEAEVARAVFSDILIRQPDSVAAMNGLGVALDLAGRHDGAQNQYRRALSIEPNLSETRNNLGLSLILGGDYAAAERILRELAASELDNAFARQHLAVAMYLQGRRSDALELATADIDEAQALALFRAFEEYASPTS